MSPISMQSSQTSLKGGDGLIMSNTHEGGNPSIKTVEDFSQLPSEGQPPGAHSSGPGTRARVVSENPAVQGSVDPRRLEAAKERAQQAAREAQQALEAQQAQIQPQSVVQEAAPTTPPSPASNPVVRKDLSQLVYLGRLEEDFEVAGYTFKLRTLTEAESTEATAGAAHITDELTRFSQWRVQVLARAIVSVDGAPLEALYQGAEQTLSSTDKKLNILKTWQPALVTSLFVHYCNMLERSDTAVSGSLGESQDLKN